MKNKEAFCGIIKSLFNCRIKMCELQLININYTNVNPKRVMFQITPKIGLIKGVKGIALNNLGCIMC